MDYQIVPLSKDNFTDLKFLYEAVFDNDYSLSYIVKKYNTEYLGKSLFGHLAYYNKKPVAFHGAIPVLMTYNNQYELAAQYGDAMTLKEHNGKGLFTKLGKLTDEQLKKAGISFVWGFPNQNSEYGYLNKMTWVYTERMQCFKVKIPTVPFEKLFRKLNLTSKAYDHYLNKKLSKFKTNKRLTGSVFKEANIVSTSRKEEFYRYKSFTNNFTIEIDEVLFWIKIKGGLLIGDVEAESKIGFENAFEKLKQLARKNGLDEIIIQCSPNTIIESWMQDISATKQETWIIGYKNFTSKFPLEKLKFTLGDLDTF